MKESSEVPVLLIIAGFLVVFPLFWCSVVWLISQFGWANLARKYRAIREIEGRRFGGCSARIGVLGANYNGCLKLIVGQAGLHLSTMILFRPGHPPLLLPWDKLKNVSEFNVMWVKRVVLELEADGTPLKLFLPVAARELLQDLKKKPVA